MARTAAMETVRTIFRFTHFRNTCHRLYSIDSIGRPERYSSISCFSSPTD